MEKEITLRFRLDDEDLENLKEMISIERACCAMEGVECDFDDGYFEPCMRLCLQSEIKEALRGMTEDFRALLESCRQGKRPPSGEPGPVPDLSALLWLLVAEANAEGREIAAYDKASLDVGEVLDGVSTAWLDRCVFVVPTQAAFV